MKKSLILIMLSMLAIVTAFAEEKDDTTIVSHPVEVMVISNDSTYSVKIKEHAPRCLLGGFNGPYNVRENTVKLSDSGFVRSSDSHIEYDVEEDTIKTEDLSMHFAAGFTAPTNVPDWMGVAPFHSFDLMWTVIQYDYSPRNSLQTYSVGLGFSWHNFVLNSDDQMYTKEANGTIDLTDFPSNARRENQYSRYSNLHYWGISLPFLFTQKFDRKGKFKLTVGAVLNFNMSGKIVNKYTIDDTDYNIQTRRIGNRPVTVDLIAIYKMYGVGLYCKYCPMSVLKSDRGPQFHSLSFGLYF